MLEVALGPRRPRTFALFELVIVLAILAVVGAIAAPRVTNSLRRQRLDMASRRILSDLNLARSQAIRDQANRKVTFSPSTKSYKLPEYIVADEQYKVELDVSPYDGVVFKSITYAPSEVVFNRLGLPQGGGTITIGDGVEKVAIAVSSTTGRTTRTFQLGP